MSFSAAVDYQCKYSLIWAAVMCNSIPGRLP